jgi:hypothetical protein
MMRDIFGPSINVNKQNELSTLSSIQRAICGQTGFCFNAGAIATAKGTSCRSTAVLITSSSSLIIFPSVINQRWDVQPNAKPSGESIQLRSLWEGA